MPDIELDLCIRRKIKKNKEWPGKDGENTNGKGQDICNIDYSERVTEDTKGTHSE